jgi:hypothetical protein
MKRHKLGKRYTGRVGGLKPWILVGLANKSQRRGVENGAMGTGNRWHWNGNYTKIIKRTTDRGNDSMNCLGINRLPPWFISTLKTNTIRFFRTLVNLLDYTVLWPRRNNFPAVRTSNYFYLTFFIVSSTFRIFSLPLLSQTPSIYVFPWGWEAKFNIHVKQWVKLQLYDYAFWVSPHFTQRYIIHSTETASLFYYGFTALCWAMAAFKFLNLYEFGRTPLTEDQPVAMPLPTHRTTQNKRTQISMLRVGFEPTTPVYERAKTVHVLDGAATVIG